MGSPELKSGNAERELVLTRLVNAPRASVFEAWTEPDEIVQWWGPRGFTSITEQIDVRPGGVWRFVMHAPGGASFPNKITYTEIVRPERICYEHGRDADGAAPDFRVAVSFEDRGGQTELTMRMICDTPEKLEFFKRFGAVEGGKQTLDRLEEYLADMSQATVD